MFDVMVRIDDFVAAVERIATALERIEAHLEAMRPAAPARVARFNTDEPEAGA